MLGANTTITIQRAIQDANSQATYAAAHHSCAAYHEPAGDGLVLAQGAPVGSLYSLFTDVLSTPDQVQISDLVTTTEGDKYVVTGIQRYENHTVLSCTSYETPTFSV